MDRGKHFAWFFILCGALSFLSISELVYAFPALFGAGPDNNEKVLANALDSAQKSILLNIYEFNSREITDILKKKINSNVSVQILIEGEPVGFVSDESKACFSQIKAAMDLYPENQNHLFVMMKSKESERRRYRFDHAKYAVIDGTLAYVTSENITSTGHPSPGSVGNRGWDVALYSPELSQKLMAIFAIDSDPSYQDVFEFTDKLTLPHRAPRPQLQATSARQKYDPSVVRKIRTSFPQQSGDVDQAELVLAPHALNPYLRVIQAAKTRLRFESLSLPLYWRTEETIINPIVSELIQAARKKIAVQILLNDDRVFEYRAEKQKSWLGWTEVAGIKALIGLFSSAFDSFWESTEDDPWESRSGRNSRGQRKVVDYLNRKNAQTVSYLQQLALSENIPLDAKIVDVKKLDITYIHNKGIIADDSRVLISSINGTHNSVTNNREVGVFLFSKDAGNYFGQIFDLDWDNALSSLPTGPL